MFIENLARDNRTIAEKIRDFLSDMVDAIKRLISEKGISKAAEGLHEQLDYYEQARDMYAYALDEASQKGKVEQKSLKRTEDQNGSRLKRRIASRSTTPRISPGTVAATTIRL